MDYWRDKDRNSQYSGTLWTEKVQRTDRENSNARKDFRMRHSNVLEPGQGTDRRGHDVVRNQEESSDDSDDFRTMINAGVHAAPVRIVPADGHVIDAYQGQKRRHCREEPERAVAGDRKRQANPITFTGAPVAVQDSLRARRIDITRPLGFTENHP